MQCYWSRVFGKLACSSSTPNIVQVAGVTYFPPPPTYNHVEFPEKTKLRFVEKVPQMYGNIRPRKMTKSLKFMRGPEEVHNFLLHRQFGIIALTGGRMKWGHFEMVRLGLLRKMDQNRMFAVWRIDAPWQPVTKKGQGQRMGGGKGPIDHYVTPLKARRVILEMGGNCEFIEVKPILELVAHKLPFAAMVVSQQMLEEMTKEEERLEQESLNPYTFKNPDNPALEENSRKTGSFAFYQGKASSIKQADLRSIFQKASKSVCTSTAVVSSDSLSPTPSTPSTMKTPGNTEKEPDDTEPADEGDIQMEYSSD